MGTAMRFCRASRSGSCRHERCGAKTTVARSAATKPAAPIPTAATASGPAHSISSATTSTIVPSTTDGLLERCGVSRRARWVTLPSASTTPPATLVPPMSIPMASPGFMRLGCSRVSLSRQVGGADHPGVIAQSGQGEPSLRPVSSAGQLAAESGKSRIDQERACLRHSPAQDDQLGIENGGDRSQPLPDPDTEVDQQLDRRGIALHCCPGDVRPPQRCGVTSAQLSQTRTQWRSGDDEILCLSDQSRAACIHLPAATIAASASNSARNHPHMAKFGGHSKGSMHEYAVDHDAATDAGANREHDHVGAVNGGTETELAPRRGVGIVLNGDGQLESRLKSLLERLVSPGKVRGEVHHRPGTIDERCAGNAHRLDLVLGGQLPGQAGGLSNDGRRVKGRCVPAPMGQNDPLIVDDTTTDLGATDVKPNRVAHQRDPSLSSSTGMSWTGARPGSGGAPAGRVLEAGSAARDHIATSRRLPATDMARSASMSTVSGRTERNNAIPRHKGQILQVEKPSWRGASPFSAPQTLQVPSGSSSSDWASAAP